MILIAIIALSGVVIALLMATLGGMPTIPSEFLQTITQLMPYVVRGVKFLNSFFYPQVVWPMAGVCLALHTFWVGYRLVMWVVKKVPMFGISD